MTELRRRSWLPAVLAALVAGGGSCDRGAGVPTTLGLEFRQDRWVDVRLNEPLTFHFSASLDPASITSESVQIHDPDHLPVRGRFRLRGTTLEFVPELPRSPDLSDGGLQPGTDYTVRLLGFPRPDGLRSRDGAPLESTFRSSFRTALPGGPVPVFLNPATEVLTFLRPEAKAIGPFDPIVLLCGEALDPSTLDASQFDLIHFGAAGEVLEIPLSARIVENARAGARVELIPLSAQGEGAPRPLLEDGEYKLLVAPSYSLAALGGRTLEPSWPWQTDSLSIAVRSSTSFREDFSDPARRSPRPPEEADGTAHWNWDADAPANWNAPRFRGVEMRYPAAAGDGRGGDLGEEFAASTPSGEDLDVAAIRFEVPAGATLDLSAVRGPVVIRSQGAMQVAGNLRRSLVDAPPSLKVQLPRFEGEGGLGRLRARLLGLPPGPNASPEVVEERRRLRQEIQSLATLSAWLAHLQATGEAWTVLVAGGDLLVTGHIDVDGPLLLVAGGWIRVSTPGRVEAAEVWRTGAGGGDIHARTAGGKREDLDEVLFLDPPQTNLLRRPLRFAVLGNPIRPPRGVRRWGAAGVDGHAGGGNFVVRYLGETEGGNAVLGPVADLDWEGRAVEAVRLRIELHMPAGHGEPWDPPGVDEVRISWKEPPGGGQ